MSKQVILTVSGTIPIDIHERIARGERPRADYLELARSFDADLIDYARARAVAGAFGSVLERVGGADLILAWACFLQRRRYRAIVTDGEQIGLPLAALLRWAGNRRPQHLMIVHIISVAKKMLFLDRLGVHSHIDRFLVYSTWQKRFIEQRWKVPAERVLFTPFMVDDRFFHPEQAPASAPRQRPQICAVGLERRDYPTLLRAVDGLNADVVVAAASPWSKRDDTTQGQHIPANVTVRKFSQFDLRQLYADSQFLVMPLENVEFQAGVTAILEAMAMGKAVICTRTPGQTDVIVEGQTGLYVPAGDGDTLRTAIQQLLDHPQEADRMGLNGRRLVEQTMGLDAYAARLRQYVHEAVAGAHAVMPDARPTAGSQ
jgi:glycosyltransferase involved in cell wall biosynthesis